MVGRLSPQWEMYLSYSLIPVATIDRIGSAQANVVGSRVGLTPTQSGALWLSYQASPKLRLAGGVRAQSTNRPLQGTTGAASTTARAPGYAALDAMAEYNFTPDVFGQINVSNLANRLYGDQLYPGFVITGAPRTVLMTVGLRF